MDFCAIGLWPQCVGRLFYTMMRHAPKGRSEAKEEIAALIAPYLAEDDWGDSVHYQLAEEILISLERLRSSDAQS